MQIPDSASQIKKVFIEEQAERVYEDWAGSIQYKCDKAASRFRGYDEMSSDEAYELGSDIFARALQKFASNECIASSEAKP